MITKFVIRFNFDHGEDVPLITTVPYEFSLGYDEDVPLITAKFVMSSVLVTTKLVIQFSLGHDEVHDGWTDWLLENAQYGLDHDEVHGPSKI